jgi:single stranded DNA-binding protein
VKIKMNKWIITGNLTEDPKLFYSEKGTAVCVFKVAANSGFGKYKKTTYVQAVTYGKSAEAHSKNLTKGAKVAIEGVGYQKKNTNKGRTYYNLQILGKEVEYLISGKDNSSGKEDLEEDYTPPALDEEDFDLPF